MYLVDVNILVYATDSDSEQHDTARDWLDEQTAGLPRSVGLPWPNLLAFCDPPDSVVAGGASQATAAWLSKGTRWGKTRTVAPGFPRLP
jgi:hypothetical protein